MLTVLMSGSWDYGWLTFFPLVSVFCNVVILLYNEKHIYFAERNVPELHAKLTQDIKKHFFTVRGQDWDSGWRSTLGRAGKENRPSILGGLAICWVVSQSRPAPELYTNVKYNTGWVLGLTWDSVLPRGALRRPRREPASPEPSFVVCPELASSTPFSFRSSGRGRGPPSPVCGREKAKPEKLPLCSQPAQGARGSH